jgi:shikimate kinase
MGHVVLVGLMGSGKTTVGAELAATLGVAHRDSDLDIQRETGLRGRDIAARDGIGGLHALEARHLLEALSEPGTTVISAAASTLDDPACQASLRDPAHFVVWLRADPAALAARLTHDDHRPDLGEQLEGVLARQATQRNQALRDVADLTLDATQPPATLVATILARLHAVR